MLAYMPRIFFHPFKFLFHDRNYLSDSSADKCDPTEDTEVQYFSQNWMLNEIVGLYLFD